MTGESAVLAARLAARLGCAPAEVAVLGPRTAPERAADARAIVIAAAAPVDVEALEARWARAGWRTAWRGAPSRRRGPVLVLRPDGDDRADALLAAGARGLLLDPAIVPPASGRLDGARIAIVTYELVGLTRTGGIGTAYTALAHALAEAGAEVDVLFTGWADEGVDADAVVAGYAGRGVRVHRLEDPDSARIRAASRHLRRAQEALDWLRGREPYAVVHVPECAGHGAAIVAARAAGTALQGTTVVVGTHGPTRWVRELNGEAIDTEDLLVLDWLERRTVEHAEVVVSPSAYLLGDLERRGWRLPERTFVQQLVLPPAALAPAAADASGPAGAGAIDELVFFGRLEPRKGFLLFCDALDALVGRVRGSRLRVTFLGRPALVDGRPATAVLDERRARWPWPVTVLPDLDQPEALAYLRGAGRLAVVPSTGDNLPLTVLETVALGVPLLTTPTGGIPEIVDPRDHARTLVAADPAALADALAAALDDPPPAPRFAVAPETSRDAHLRWHAGVAAAAAAGPAPSADGAAGAAPRPCASGVAVVPLGGEAPPEDAELVLLLSDRHALDDGAVEVLARVARRTGAPAVTFAVCDADGRVVVAPGGPAVLAVVARPLSTGSALVRAEHLDAVPRDEAELEALLARLALAGLPPFPLPEVLASEHTPPPPDAGVETFAGLLPAPLADLPAYARATAAERDDVRAALGRADARVLELDALFHEARTKLERAEAELARVDAARDLAERRLRGLQRRKAVRLALALAAVYQRARARLVVRR
jgi:glycosyltransferase involved in cell wall biosynthesis